MLETNKFKKRKRSNQPSTTWLNSSSNRAGTSVLSEEPPSPVPSHVSSNEENLNEKMLNYERTISNLKMENKKLIDRNKQLKTQNKKLLKNEDKNDTNLKSVRPLTKKSNISLPDITKPSPKNIDNQPDPSEQETMEDVDLPSKPLIKTRKIRFADEELKKIPIFRKIFRFDSEECASNKNGTEVNNFLHWDCPLIAGIPKRVVIFRDMIPTIECEEVKIHIHVTMTPAEPDDAELAVNVDKPKIIPF